MIIYEIEQYISYFESSKFESEAGESAKYLRIVYLIRKAMKDNLKFRNMIYLGRDASLRLVSLCF